MKTFCIISLLIVTLLCGLLPIKVSELSSTKKGKTTHEPMKKIVVFFQKEIKEWQEKDVITKSYYLSHAPVSWLSCTVSVITNQIVCYRYLFPDPVALS